MERKIFLFLSCLILAAPVVVKAQDRGEISVFGGYSRLWNSSANNGWNASIAGNITKHMALVADFSGYYNSFEYSGSSYIYSEGQHREYSFLFGPRYVHRIGKRWTPFAHSLAGLKRNISQSRETLGPTTFTYGPTANNIFALAFGGGLDVRMSNRISVRALQFDGVGLTEGGMWGYYLRASFGMVFRLSGDPK